MPFFQGASVLLDSRRTRQAFSTVYHFPPENDEDCEYNEYDEAGFAEGWVTPDGKGKMTPAA